MSSVKRPAIVLVGRTNTGKSTLFNRLTGKDLALVSAIAGTTRDWKEALVEWCGHEYTVIDTGGIEHAPSRGKVRLDAAARAAHDDASMSAMQRAVEEKAWQRIAKADVLFFLVDGRAGLLEQDRILAHALQKTGAPVFLVINKLERAKDRIAMHEFLNLGLGEPFGVSARTGSGVGDLLDAAAGAIARASGVDETPPVEQKSNYEPFDDDPAPLAEAPRTRMRIAIIGKPNVGKSSLVNALLGEERVIVSPIPGTTREPIDTDVTIDGNDYTLIDTAGIRRNKSAAEKLEQAGVDRTERILHRTDIALFVIEGNKDLTSQDLRLARLLVDGRVSVVIIANKWDLVRTASQHESEADKRSATQNFSKTLFAEIPHLSFAPILFLSAKTSRSVDNVIAMVEHVRSERIKVISEETLELWLKKLPYRATKQSGEKEQPYLYGMKQTAANPPAFVLTAQIKKLPTRKGVQKMTVRDSYVRFLENRLRDAFGFAGTPLRVEVRGIKR